MTKTLLIDLDGVLNTYSGNYKDEEIPEPRKNVDTFLKKLSEKYKIKIFTVRNKKQTLQWLIKYNLDKYICDITNIKEPYASIIIDDRALKFNGDFEKTLLEIENFSPFWKT